MIDTVLLCMAWAVIGYALAIIEHERSSPTPNPRQQHSAGHTPPQPSANAISLKHRPDRFACFHCKRWRHNQRFDIAWCDRDHAEFPELCPEYDPKHSHQTIDFVSSLVYQKT